MLLTEHIPFTVDRKIIEESISSNKPLIVKGVIQRAEAKNQNGRIYPKEILEREIEKYIEGPVRESRALGELDHPESSVINLQNVSHNFRLKTELDMNSGTFLKSTNKKIHELGSRLKQLENKLREFSN